MKKWFFVLLLLPAAAFAQDTTGKPTPGVPSNDNYDLLLIAVIGFVVLLAIYFIFRKTRKRQD